MAVGTHNDLPQSQLMYDNSFFIHSSYLYLHVAAKKPFVTFLFFPSLFFFFFNMIITSRTEARVEIYAVVSTSDLSRVRACVRACVRVWAREVPVALPPIIKL